MEHGEHNPLAFPNTDGQTFCHDGMTLMDYFAAQALQGLILLADKRTDKKCSTVKWRCQQAYDYAKQMIEERKNHE